MGGVATFRLATTRFASGRLASRRLATVLLWLWFAPLLGAQEQPKKPAFVWYTQFGDQVLNRVDAVLIGKVEEVTALRGTDVVRVSVVDWKWGDRDAKLGSATEVTLLAQPGDFYVGNEQLLFLERFEKGSRYTLVNRVAKSDPDWEQKLECLAANLRLKPLERDEDRRREVRKALYDGLAARVVWTRWHAWQELVYVKSKYPDLVTREDRVDLEKLANRLDDAKLKKALQKLLEEWDS